MNKPIPWLNGDFYDPDLAAGDTEADSEAADESLEENTFWDNDLPHMTEKRVAQQAARFWATGAHS